MNQVKLSPLQRADGSAAFSANGYTVICAVNGPVEVQRRDELPEEAALDVLIHPAAGAGSKNSFIDHLTRMLIPVLACRYSRKTSGSNRTKYTSTCDPYTGTSANVDPGISTGHRDTIRQRLCAWCDPGRLCMFLGLPLDTC